MAINNSNGWKSQVTNESFKMVDNVKNNETSNIMKKTLDDSDIKTSLIGILQFVVDLCNDNNISYFLAYGSLLGAIRHSGMIPWDDDIDICIKRPDYEKLLGIMKKNESGRYKLLSIETESSYSLPLPKIIDRTTELVQEDINSNNNLGIYIDIFVLDGMPNNKILKELYYYHVIFLLRLWGLAEKRIFRSSSNMSLPKKCLIVLLAIPCKLIGSRRISRYLNFLGKSIRLEGSKTLFSNCFNAYGKREILSYNYFENPRKISFDGILCSIPNQSESYLAQLYDDWTVLPPQDKQVRRHDYSVTWRQ